MASDDSLRARLVELYTGRSAQALTFRFALLGIDIAIVLFFFVTTMVGTPTWVIVTDVAFGIFIVFDLAARFVIARSRRRFLFDPFTWADVVVTVSLLAPTMVGNFTFLRVLRALRILRSYHVLRELRRSNAFFRRNEEVMQSALNLFVFVFIVSAVVFALQAGPESMIRSYADALYFTVATLTTTGFGDIVLSGQTGRWLSIVIMVVGVGLFLRLVQSIFRPPKVRHRCPDCGLLLHDPDAVHCKHCGRTLNIETEGA